MSGEGDGVPRLRNYRASALLLELPLLNPATHVLLYCFITFVQVCPGLIYIRGRWLEKPSLIRVLHGSVAVSLLLRIVSFDVVSQHVVVQRVGCDEEGLWRAAN
jgi:hypothetical protein